MKKNVIEEYVKQGEQCDIMKALTLLTQAYISMCGISLGYRTVIYCAAESWQEKLAWLDLPLSEMARKEPFVHLMPHISKDYVPEYYDEYDITGMNCDELLSACNQMIRNKEFDETTLEVISWGILKATEEKPELSKEIESTAPDGTSLKGVLKEQRCYSTFLIMTSPYADLSAVKYELVRDPQELLISAYKDYQWLHEKEDEIRSLYSHYQFELQKLEKKSVWNEHNLFEKTFGVILNDTVLVSPKKLFYEWFGIKFEYDEL